MYLGTAYSDLVLTSRIILAGSLGYTVYISLRSALDAYYIKAVNTKNIFIALVFFMLFSAIVWITGGNYFWIISIFVIAVSALGILTIFDTYKIFRLIKK